MQCGIGTRPGRVGDQPRDAFALGLRDHLLGPDAADASGECLSVAEKRFHLNSRWS